MCTANWATLSKTNSVVATDSCQDKTLLSNNDDSFETEQNSDTSNEDMDIEEDDLFLPGNDEDEQMDLDNITNSQLIIANVNLLKSITNVCMNLNIFVVKM